MSEHGMEPQVERDERGAAVKVAVDADVAVVVTGEGVEEEAVLLLGGRHELPINLAEVIEEHFGHGQESSPRSYGPLRITIERPV